MQATYPRNRQNVHSLAQPTVETKREGIRPYIFPPQRDWLREG